MEFDPIEKIYKLNDKELVLHEQVFLPMSTDIAMLPELSLFITKIAASLGLTIESIYKVSDDIIYQHASLTSNEYTILMEILAHDKNGYSTALGITRDEKTQICLGTSSGHIGSTCILISALALILSNKIPAELIRYQKTMTPFGNMEARPSSIKIDGNIFNLLPLIYIAHELFGGFSREGYERLMELSLYENKKFSRNIQSIEHFNIATAKDNIVKQYIKLKKIAADKIDASIVKNVEITEQEIRHMITLLSHSTIKIDFTECNVKYYKQIAQKIYDLTLIWHHTDMIDFEDIRQVAIASGYQGTTDDQDISRLISAAVFTSGIDKKCQYYVEGVPIENLIQ